MATLTIDDLLKVMHKEVTSSGCDLLYCWCLIKFANIASKLKDTHVIIGSCNQDKSMYLVPIGTENQITYESKPENSYRISDHWNWYSNVKKCPKESYIQCWNVDLPGPFRRKGPGLASDPVEACCVAKYEDGRYHTVTGAVYDWDNKVFDLKINL